MCGKQKLRSCLKLMLVTCILAISQTASIVPAKADVINFNMTDTGYPPFMIHRTEMTGPGGIMHDVLAEIVKPFGFRLVLHHIPKKREIRSFQTGLIDAHAIAREWVAHPEAFVFTDPIINIRNVIYSPRRSTFSFRSIEDLRGKIAITHLGYKYPPISHMLESNQIRRLDAKNELSMLKMLRAGRGDLAILNETLGSWLVETHGMRGDFIVSRKSLTNFPFRIMFSKPWKPYLAGFNRELDKLKKDGRFRQILVRYKQIQP